MKSRFIIVTLCLLTTSASLAEVFKTVDEHGKVVYSDHRSDAAVPVPLEAPKTAVQPPATSIDDYLPAPTPKITLFATQWCGYCRKERQFFKHYGIAYQEIDTETPQGAAEFRRIGGNGVPVTLIGQQRIDGFSEEALRYYLQAAGVTLGAR